MDELLPELLYKILSYMSKEDQWKLSRVNRAFRHLVQHPDYGWDVRDIVKAGFPEEFWREIEPTLGELRTDFLEQSLLEAAKTNNFTAIKSIINNFSDRISIDIFREILFELSRNGVVRPLEWVLNIREQNIDGTVYITNSAVEKINVFFPSEFWMIRNMFNLFSESNSMEMAEYIYKLLEEHPQIGKNFIYEYFSESEGQYTWIVLTEYIREGRLIPLIYIIEKLDPPVDLDNNTGFSPFSAYRDDYSVEWGFAKDDVEVFVYLYSKYKDLLIWPNFACVLLWDIIIFQKNIAKFIIEHTEVRPGCNLIDLNIISLIEDSQYDFIIYLIKKNLIPLSFFSQNLMNIPGDHSDLIYLLKVSFPDNPDIQSINE